MLARHDQPAGHPPIFLERFGFAALGLCLMFAPACGDSGGGDTGTETETGDGDTGDGDGDGDSGDGDGDTGDGDGDTGDGDGDTGDGDGDGDGDTGDGDGDGDTGDGDAAIVAAGWSFGQCAGGCVGNLTIAPDDVLVFTIEDWSEQVVGQNGGALTLDGRTQLDDAAAQLLGVTLDEVYGCPDCNDGGASYLHLVRDGEMSAHLYEFGNPPPVLAEADGLVTEVMAALKTCVDSPLLTLDDGCVPL